MSTDTVGGLQRTAISQFLQGHQVLMGQRRTEDQAAHKAVCQACREGRRPDITKGEILYAVKNRETRQMLHVVARSGDEARALLGWTELDTAYTMAITIPTEKGKMPEHIKLRLRQLNKQRRVEKRQRREEVEAQMKAQGIDKSSPLWYNHGVNKTNKSPKKGGEKMEKDKNTLAVFVKDFIEDQITEKKDGKDVVNMNSLFALAKANGIDASKYRKDLEPGTAGRIRMTIGNMIRGAASKNHKLVTLGGASKLVPEGLIPVKAEKKAKEKTKKAPAKKKAA